jgi:hypothetical protein
MRALHSALRRLAAPLAAILLASCGGAEGDWGENQDDVTSATATYLQFEFDGQLLSASNANLATQVKAQMFYAVGQLNAHSSVARLDRLRLVTLSSAAAGSGLYKISYHAKLPVAWGSKINLPTSFLLHFPLRADATGLTNFFSKYQATCAEQIGDQITGGNFWYHFRPEQAGCALPAADALAANATVTVSTANTNGKYPEYHLVWQDRTLRVVAVFGKYSPAGTDETDAGIRAFDNFIAAVRARLPAGTVTPAFAGAAGIGHPDVTVDFAAQWPHRLGDRAPRRRSEDRAGRVPEALRRADAGRGHDCLQRPRWTGLEHRGAAADGELLSWQISDRLLGRLRQLCLLG